MNKISIINIILLVLLTFRCTEEKNKQVETLNILAVDSNANSIHHKLSLNDSSNISVIDHTDGITEKGILINGKRNGVWKKFSSSKTLESVSYYFNDSLLYELDKDDYNFVEYRINETAKISYPNKWKIIKSAGLIASFMKEQSKENKEFVPLINIQQDKISNSKSFSNYVNKELEVLRSNPTFKLIKLKEYGSDSLLTIQAVYIIIIQDIKLGVVTNWIKHKDKVYIINGMASNKNKGDFLHYKELFQDILFSFNVDNQTNNNDR